MPDTRQLGIFGMGLYHFACLVAVAVSLLAGAPAFAADVAAADDIQKCKASDRYHDPMAAFYTCDNALKQKDLSKEDRAELLLGRGEAAYFVGRFDLASWDLDEAIKLNPNLNEAYLRRAWIRMRKFQYPGALHDLSNLLGQEPDNIDGLFAIGFFYKDTSEWESKSIPAFKRVLELDPNHYLSRLNLGTIYADRKGDFDAAIAEYDRILSASDEDLNKVKLWRDPVRPYFDLRGTVRADRVSALARKEKYAQALAEADGLVASYPDVGDAFVTRAHIYSRLRKFDEALADARTASKLEPDGDDQKALEVQTLVQLERYDDALSRANEVLNKPMSEAVIPDILFWRAYTKKKMHLPDEALQDFERSFLYKSWHLSAALTQAKQSGYYDGNVTDEYSERARDGLQACILDPECGAR